MLAKATRSVLFVFFVVMFVIVACTPVGTPDPTEITQPTAELEAVKGEPKRGGTMIFPISEEPPLLNPYLSFTGWEAMITEVIYEGLAGLGPDGEYYPILAAELPTLENGGLSEDRLTVTWRLRQDVLWSDGEPFTAEDVRFTWEGISHPESGAMWAPGFDLIESIEAPDEHTVVIHYSQPYPLYLGQFSQGIFPKHACGDPSDAQNWTCNREPVGTGPFVVAEWVAGDHITAVRNPHYREEGKPYLESIIFQIVPAEEVHKQMMLKGDADGWMWIDILLVDELTASGNVVIAPGSEQWLMRLIFKLSEKGDRRPAPPAKPHRILGDTRVRQAIQMAVNSNAIADKILAGQGEVMPHELYHGLTVCPKPETTTYDPDTARALLEEAGWTDQDGDGIRECNGCQYAEEGSRLTLVLSTFADIESYNLIQQFIVDNLLEVGIEMKPRFEEDAVLDDLAVQGDFDVIMWDDGYTGPDPTDFLASYYLSETIPMEEGAGGFNITRFHNERFDELLGEVSESVEQEQRLAAFCEMDRILSEELPMAYLFVLPYPNAFSTRIQGWEANTNDYVTWDSENWWIRE
jgi:peptide/nickel transport system substrate-binding protein